jgi:hypothetical protein
MQGITRTKAALVTTAIMGGGLGAMALLPGTAMAAQLQPGPAQSPPLTATAGSQYQYTFTASGDPSWSLVGAPGWLSINDGTVSGTVPQGTTSFSYSVTVTNGSWSYTDGPYTVQVGNGRQSGQPGHGYGNGQNADLSTALNCPSSVRSGRTGSCTLTVSNSGSGTARDVTATIDLPSALQAENCGDSSNWHWGWNGSGCTVSGNDATEQIRSIGAGQSRTMSVYFRATGGWSWNRGHTVEVTANAQAGNEYGYRGHDSSAQSTAYVTVYGGRRY